MTNTKPHHWLLTVALFSLPVAVASWWMLSGGQPEERGENLSRTVKDRADTTDRLNATADHANDATNPAEGQRVAGEFTAYAEELRAQGFPVTTVRDLVASRITAAFEGRRTALRNEARRAGADTAGIRTQLDALGREQGALIVQIVGGEEVPAAGITLQVQDDPIGGKEQVLMPAVMSEAMPATVKTQEQVAAWEELRGDFVNAIGGTDADPASPRYRQRWVRAESEADQRFRLVFGDTAYVQHQMQAQHEALMQQQGVSGK